MCHNHANCISGFSVSRGIFFSEIIEILQNIPFSVFTFLFTCACGPTLSPPPPLPPPPHPHSHPHPHPTRHTYCVIDASSTQPEHKAALMQKMAAHRTDRHERARAVQERRRLVQEQEEQAVAEQKAKVGFHLSLS